MQIMLSGVLILKPATIEMMRRKKYRIIRIRQKINLDAIYNTICDRCGKTGHIKTECFNKGKSYELIPENMVSLW